jgi:hypothetical protein
MRAEGRGGARSDTANTFEGIATRWRLQIVISTTKLRTFCVASARAIRGRHIWPVFSAGLFAGATICWRRPEMNGSLQPIPNHLANAGSAAKSGW